MKTYTSKNTIEAFQVSEEMFEDVTKAMEAQKLPLNEVHYTVDGKFCTLNCLTKQLIYQGVVLNIGDYLIKSGNSLEACSKDKFEDEFYYNKPCCGECNHEGTLPEVIKAEFQDVVEKVEEMVKENPETAPFIDKVKDIVAQFFPKDQRVEVKELQDKEIFLKSQLDKFLEFTKENSYITMDQSTMTLEEIVSFSLTTLDACIKSSDEAIKQRDEEIKDCHTALDKIITALYARFNLPEDFYAGKQLQETIDMLLTQLASDFAEHETMKSKLNGLLMERPLETQEDYAEEILALMKKINLKSVTRDISGEVPENTFDYFKTTDEIKN